jgi:hypothetical protein
VRDISGQVIDRSIQGLFPDIFRAQPGHRLGWTTVPRFQQCSAPLRDVAPTCNPLGAEMPKEGLGRVIYKLPASPRHSFKAYLDGGSPIVAWEVSVHMAPTNLYEVGFVQPVAPDTLKISIVPGSHISGKGA